MTAAEAGCQGLCPSCRFWKANHPESLAPSSGPRATWRKLAPSSRAPRPPGAGTVTAVLPTTAGGTEDQTETEKRLLNTQNTTGETVLVGLSARQEPSLQRNKHHS